MMRLAFALAAAVLALPTAAAAARFGVGVAPGASVADVRARIVQAGVRPVAALGPLRTIVVRAESARSLRSIHGVSFVERLDVRRRVAFTTNDPLAPRQWYLAHDRAFDVWPQLPALPGVRVAVIDSGIDAGHPEFAGKIFAGKSFIGDPWNVDRIGHGTFVAGEIAAAANNAQGIAGIAFPAQLLIGKVVHPDGSISIEAEAKAIRWAVDSGARVINLSLSGIRDPLNRQRDTYSPLEARAIAYAYSKGVVLVAAVGNSDQAPKTPWRYASYPAALPHVLGVSALARDGSVPLFSDRDPIYNDLAAPGQEILSTFPRQLTAARPACVNQGYSDCGPEEYRRAEGTSFAAPQVTAAAALLLASRPGLAAEQVTTLLERTAVDVNATNGCRPCPVLRDELSGWGKLDITAAVEALSGELPPRDRYEPNDDAGEEARTMYGLTRNIVATLDFWDDQIDVYRVKLQRGQRLVANLRGPENTDTNLVLWRPGTQRVEDIRTQSLRIRRSTRPGAVERLAHVTTRTGWYYLQVKLATPGNGEYTLAFSKSEGGV